MGGRVNCLVSPGASMAKALRPCCTRQLTGLASGISGGRNGLGLGGEGGGGGRDGWGEGGQGGQGQGGQGGQARCLSNNKPICG